MPAPQAPESYYQLLEQSFGDGPTILKSQKTVPRRQKIPRDIITSVAPVGPHFHIERGQVLPPVKTSRSPLTSSYLLNGHDSELPPTPPSNSHDTTNGVVISPAHSEPVRSSLAHKSSSSTTPRNQRSPPTPDQTPPASLSVPQRETPSALSSSRADSFRTAREEQWLSDEEEEEASDRLAKGDVSARSMAVRVHRSLNQEPGLGLEFEREDGDLTPTQRTPQPRKMTSIPDGMKSETVPEREWDSNLMRNVTVRRKRPRRADGKEDERRLAEREILPQLTAASSEEEVVEPQTPSPSDVSPEKVWSADMNSNHDSYRLSNASTNSNILEAIVIASPPRRRQTLRHVSRNLFLRSDAGSSAATSPTTRSDRNSWDSDDFSLHRLNHKRASIANGKVNFNPMFNSTPTTPPVALKHHRESSSLRSDSLSSHRDGAPDRRRSQGTRSVSSTIPSALGAGNINQRNVSAPVGMVPSRSPPQSGKPSDTRVSKVQFKDLPVTKSPSAEGLRRQVSDSTRAATTNALQQVQGLEAQPEQKSRRSSVDANVRKVRQSSMSSDGYRRKSSSTIPKATLEQPSAVQPITPTEPEHRRQSSQDTIKGSLSTHRGSIGTHRSSVGDAVRPTIDLSTVESSENTRLSVDQSSIKTDEHAMARHLYAQTTPFSITSDTHDPLEVSEATAISLFPHNNNSLLVIEQASRPPMTFKEIMDSQNSTAQDSGPPAVMVQPATPPQMSEVIRNVDSPLRNPRKPPQIPLQVPAIRLLAATPAEELEESPLDNQELNPEPEPEPLKRRISLRDRARHYSDTIVRPIIARTTSLKRTYYNRPRSPYRRTDQLEGNGNTLHPFWQPRGFWDEFSDSDSDFGEPEGGAARLPPGGDTSEIPDTVDEPPRGFARIMDGFKGSGGFLIGNSMGLERHGTNNRRHHISLPVGLGRRRSNRVVRKTSDGPLKTWKSIESLRKMNYYGNGDKKVWKVLGLHIQYLGVSGMKHHLRERSLEKKRDKIRKSIGPRFVVEGAPTTN